MHTSEIRRHCYHCGHHRLVSVPYAEMKTDYCHATGQECSKIISCHPDMRIPKGRRELPYLKSARGRVPG